MPASRSCSHIDRIAVVDRLYVSLDHPAESLAVRSRLVDHDPVQLGMGGGEVHEAAKGLAEGPPDRHRVVGVAEEDDHVAQAGGEQIEEMVDGGSPERLLRVEVVVDLRLVGVDAQGDGPGGRAVVSLLGELHEGGVEQLLAKVVSGPALTPLSGHVIV